MAKSKISEFAYFGGAAVAVTAMGATGAQAQQEFGGLYGGLSLGIANGNDLFGQGDTYSFEGSSVGGMVGYNVVQGDWVFGGEISYANEFALPNLSYGDGGLKDVIDLRGRVGRVFGSTLVYGAVGYTLAELHDDNSFLVEANGFNVGVGAEQPIGENAFIGLDITLRNLDHDFLSYTGPGPMKMTTGSVRFGMRF